ncbi:MAG: hypothetical protein ABSG67_12085 [Thermoguttaceae bacterium]|jgi:hypothetical protein
MIILSQYDLPSPAYANRQELFAWLACKDLSKQSWQNRLILANRLEQECSRGLDWKSLGANLNETQQNRVWGNIPLLLRPWFVEKARSYAVLTAEKRLDYIDRLIDIITAWTGLENLLPNRMNVLPGEKSPSGLSNLLCSEIDRIVEESDPPDCEQINELWKALKVRWLFRILGSPSAA